MKNKYIILMFLITSITLFADTSFFDNLFNKKQNSFNKTLSEKKTNFENKISQKDMEFNENLKKSWNKFDTEVESLKGLPKPIDKPIIDPVDFTIIDKEKVKINKTVIPEEITPKEDPEGFSFTNETKEIKVDFYEDDLTYLVPNSFFSNELMTLNIDTINESWIDFTKMEYLPFITQIKNDVTRLKLNSWGIYTLVTNISNKIYKNSSKEAILGAFILTQLGLNSKVGFSGNSSYILIESPDTLYGKIYLTINNSKYYIISSNNKIKNISTYTADYPGIRGSFNFSKIDLPLIKPDIKNKTLSFDYYDQNYTVPISYNKSLINFFADYPQTDFNTYFSSELYVNSKNRLVAELTKLVEDKSEAEAVNKILHFVQKAFDYKSDDEQFNREKPFFPEETLYYEYSDCEDRAILFTYLIKRMLNLKVLGLIYPRHMSAAVLLKNPVGNTVLYNGEEYTITDPTYINANIGRAMPSYENLIPEIVGENL